MGGRVGRLFGLDLIFTTQWCVDYCDENFLLVQGDGGL